MREVKEGKYIDMEGSTNKKVVSRVQEEIIRAVPPKTVFKTLVKILTGYTMFFFVFLDTFGEHSIAATVGNPALVKRKKCCRCCRYVVFHIFFFFFFYVGTQLWILNFISLRTIHPKVHTRTLIYLLMILYIYTQDIESSMPTYTDR